LDKDLLHWVLKRQLRKEIIIKTIKIAKVMKGLPAGFSSLPKSRNPQIRNGESSK